VPVDAFDMTIAMPDALAEGPFAGVGGRFIEGLRRKESSTTQRRDRRPAAGATSRAD